MSEESSQTCLWLKITETQRNYASPISCCCDCPSFGLLSFGGQIVHINEGKGTLALFYAANNVLLTPLFPFLFSSSSTILLFSFLNFSFPPPQFQNFPSSSSTFLLFSLLLLFISIVFPPPPSPHFYCFPSTTTTYLLFSFHPLGRPALSQLS